MFTKKMTALLLAVTATSLGGLTLSPALGKGETGKKVNTLVGESKEGEGRVIVNQTRNRGSQTQTSRGQNPPPHSEEHCKTLTLPYTALGPVPVPKMPPVILLQDKKGLFVVEGRVKKDGTAEIVRFLHIPPHQDRPDYWLGEHVEMDPGMTKKGKTLARRWKNWHKMVDKRVEMLMTPDGTLVGWEEIGTGRRMVRGIKKLFGKTALFSSNREAAQEAEHEVEQGQHAMY
jgi:hypothetical protein